MFDPVEQASALIAALRDTEAESESQRRLSDRAVTLLRESGLSRMMAPAAQGGLQLSPRALVDANRVVAHGSVAASWVQMVCGAHTFMAGRFPERCLDEVFGSDPGGLLPGVPSAQGTCKITDGGFLVSGRWSFVSGSAHGDWFLFGTRGVRNDDGVPTPGHYIIVPRTDVTIDDVWHTLGMRGTGSNDAIAENIFVPGHRAVRLAEASMGTVPGIEAPVYRLPVAATLSTMALGTMVGIAERGLQTFIDETTGRVDAYTGEEKKNRTGLQFRAAEASGEIGHAWALARRNCDLLEAAMENEPPMPVSARIEVRWNSAYATELCRRAADRLFAGAGAKATFDNNPLQTFFRNINVATHHGVLDYDSALEMRGRQLLGVDQPEAFI